jgi:hypothetical protein
MTGQDARIAEFCEQLKLLRLASEWPGDRTASGQDGGELRGFPGEDPGVRDFWSR